MNRLTEDTRLDRIRKQLFYGPREYTKSFPDFSIPQKFVKFNPSKGPEFLANLVESLADEPEVLVYIHLPFCHEECVFCNAFPHKVNRKLQADYLDGLLRGMELFSDAGVFTGKRVRAVYIGGGTPTTYSRRNIGRIVERIHGVMELAENFNITCEAHPEALASETRAGELAELGIHRISLGCQTFDRRVMRLCNRDNPENLLRRVVDTIRGVGLDVNVDMMIGLPGQTVDGVRRDLEILERIRPSSIEYMRHEIVNPLAIDLFQRRPELVVSDGDLFQMVCSTQGWMEATGYEQSGRFTGPRFFPYRYHWLRETPILAFGSRARSYAKDICYDSHESLALFQQMTARGMPPIGRFMVLTPRDQMFRSMFLGLQFRDGVQRATFETRFGQDPTQSFGPMVSRLVALGCMEVTEDAVRLTRLGRTFVEDVSCFIIDSALDEEVAGQPRLSHGTSTASARIQRLR